jgi:hypothetical protein
MRALPRGTRPDQDLIHLERERADELMVALDRANDTPEAPARRKRRQAQHGAAHGTHDIEIEDRVVLDACKQHNAITTWALDVAAGAADAAQDGEIRTCLDEPRPSGVISSMRHAEEPRPERWPSGNPALRQLLHDIPCAPAAAIAAATSRSQ